MHADYHSAGRCIETGHALADVIVSSISSSSSAGTRRIGIAGASLGSALPARLAGTKPGSINPVTQSLLDFFDDITEGARDGPRRRTEQVRRANAAAWSPHSRNTSLEQQDASFFSCRMHVSLPQNPLSWVRTAWGHPVVPIYILLTLN